MSDIDDVKHAVNEWLEGLDIGDLERMIATCDPEVVICNERQQTTVGIQAVRDKYGPRIDANTFKSTYDIQHIRVYGDMAMMIGRFTVAFTNKESGQQGGGEGRLTLCYRRHTGGSWKLVLDVDNNDHRDAA